MSKKASYPGDIAEATRYYCAINFGGWPVAAVKLILVGVLIGAGLSSYGQEAMCGKINGDVCSACGERKGSRVIAGGGPYQAADRTIECNAVCGAAGYVYDGSFCSDSAPADARTVSYILRLAAGRRVLAATCSGSFAEVKPSPPLEAWKLPDETLEDAARMSHP